MKKQRILLVEDSKEIAQAVVMNLEYAGYDSVLFEDGQSVVEYLKGDHRFDIAVLDIMVPYIDGFELMSYMKDYGIPVIYMTAKADLDSEIQGLRAGAEDYVMKPFKMQSLLVRIEKILERHGQTGRVYEYKNIVVDEENRSVTKDGIEVCFAPVEFDVFLLLLKNKNRTVSRNKILDEVWGEDFFGDTRTVDVRIAMIRKKLELLDEIRTIPKTGYRLEEKDWK
ncbi:MAG: response regulator transcription factor [Eubacteriales bacterium]